MLTKQNRPPLLTAASLHALLATAACKIEDSVINAIDWRLPFGKEAAMLRMNKLLSRPQR